jgi:aspartyl aminopeptidase
MVADPRAVTDDLIAFIDGSPSPYHACATAAARLDAAGFVRLDERDAWGDDAARAYVVRGGTLVAWSTPTGWGPETGFRLVGAHTDSPNLRVKPRPDTGSVGYRQLGVEIYGGVLLNSWLDRDLGLSGRVTLRGPDGPEVRLFHVDRPLLRIPQLAIHLDREINERGLKLNKQTHLSPLWGLGPPDEGEFRRFLAAELDVSEADLASWDVMTHDLTPSTVAGVDGELVSAPRIDNLASCHAAVTTLTGLADGAHERTAVVSLFDHEEVGSLSSSGADSPILATLLERLVARAGGDRETFHRALASSVCVSADGAHATNPNYPDRHEPDHRIALNGGPVLKLNANERYATDALSAAVFEQACVDAGVPLQRFVSRSDLPCGSTIGPITSGRLGVSTVDVGIPQLAMHSARELCGSADPALLIGALTTFLR